MAGGTPAQPVDTNKIYHASREEVAAARSRAATRLARKAEFQKKFTNPAKGVVDAGPVFDPAMQRFMSMKVSLWDGHKVTFRNTWAFLFGSVLPILAIYKYLNYEETRREKVFRSGSIPYKERLWKYD